MSSAAMEPLQKDFDILVAGEINPDLILSAPGLAPAFGQQEILVDELNLVIGSSSAIFACGAARLGLKVAMVGLVGDDHFGRFMLEGLAQQGVDVSAVRVSKKFQTGASVILDNGANRAILTYPGAIALLRSEDIDRSLLDRSRHLHIASYFLQTELQPGLPALFGLCKQLGLSTSLDTNWDPDQRWSGVSDLLALTDIFFPNEMEALALTGESEISLALETLVKQGTTVAVKMGAAGAIAQRKNLRVQAAALPVEVVDTVGAGDSFDAGFVYGYLHDWSLERCLALAVTCGSLSTRKHGGTPAQPTLDEATRFMKLL